MSYLDYRYCMAQLGVTPANELAKALAAQWKADPPFYGVVMVAMFRADTFNHAKLTAAWPDTWAECQARYNAPLGLLPSDPPALRRRVAEAHGFTWEDLPPELRTDAGAAEKAERP